MGKLPTAPGQRVYMLPVTDYFTKWVEAEAYHQVYDREVKIFIWKNVICHFGVPKEIVTKNGSQFISFNFQDFCKEWGIKLSFSNPHYPKSNGQAESTNKTFIKIIKKRLKKAKGLWVDELTGVFWAYRTTTHTSLGETPFSLAYGTEVVIPIECGIPFVRYIWLNEDTNQELLNHNLDAFDELHDKAHLRTTFYQHKAAQHYNKNIRVRTFKIGD